MLLPPLQYWLSWSVVLVAFAFLFNACVGIYGINKMTLRRSLPLLVFGLFFTLVAARQVAEQNFEADKTTGGDSYPEVIPEGRENVSLVILNVGHSILPAVSVTLEHIGPGGGELKQADVLNVAPSDAKRAKKPVTITIRHSSATG
jgi:hypothetical protein